MTINIAHRGFSGEYPENTMLAFQKALDLGVDAIELDVQLSKDGEVMIFHDENLKRITGESGFLMDYTYSQLRKLNASGKFAVEFGINLIPTLAEYLEFTQNIEVITFLELKNSMIPYPHLEEKVCDVIYRFRQQNKIILFSANHPSVIHFGSLAPEVKLLFPFDNWIYDYGAYCRKHGISACMPYFHALTPQVVAEIKAHGVAIYPWIVDDPPDMETLLSMGMDGILTNFPDRLNDVLTNKQKRDGIV